MKILKGRRVCHICLSMEPHNWHMWEIVNGVGKWIPAMLHPPQTNAIKDGMREYP